MQEAQPSTGNTAVVVDVTRLLSLEDRGFCWSVGRTRLAAKECRIWPKSITAKGPVLITNGKDWEEAIGQALERLGNQKPNDFRIRPH